jgi:hypothetical protein
MKSIDFESRFAESNGKPFTIDDSTYCLLHRVYLSSPAILHLKFIQSRPPYRQGIHIEADNKLTINQITEESFLLWEDTAPQTVECLVPGGEVRVWNVWDTGDGVTQSWHNGAAMIVDCESPAKLFFRCNDGQPNSDCDDLVFRCEIAEIQSAATT